MNRKGANEGMTKMVNEKFSKKRKTQTRVVNKKEQTIIINISNIL